MAVWTTDDSGRAPYRRGRGWSAAATLADAEEQRWFLWLPVMFGIGIALYFAAATEPQLVLLLAAVMCAGVLYGLIHRPHLALAAAAAFAIAAGGLVAKLRTELVRAPALVQSTNTVLLTGWLERIEPRATAGQRLTIRVVSLGALAPDQTPRLVRVRMPDKDPTLKPGDGVRLRASLGPPPQPAAPRDFDFGRLAYFSRLGGFGIGFGAVERVALEAHKPWILRLLTPVEQLRQAIRERIVAALPGETGEIATALITGERGGITEETNQAYRNAGLFHILSISGLHMVIMAGAVFYLLRAGLALFPSIALRYPIKAWAAAGAIAGAFAYLMISGGAFATVRSWIMITIMFSAVILDRPALSLRNVALAALFILVPWPESLFDAGFQMSFAAVVGLVSAYEWLRQRRAGRAERGIEVGRVRQGLRFFGEIVLSTVVASFVVAPFGIYHFHNTQLLAILGNVVAIPVCNLIVMPAALGVLVAMPFGLEGVPLWVMGYGIDAMSAVARWVGALPGAVVKVPEISTLAFVMLVGGGMWLLLWTTWLRWLGVMPVAIGIALAPTMSRPDILIGRDGTTLAVRAADGRLSALAVRGRSFDLARWLELDGDARAPEAVATATAFQCDGIGCTARVRGRLVTVALTPAALEDDCPRADIIVIRSVVPRGCAGAPRPGRIVLDATRTAAAGAHALYLDGATIRIETVAQQRGDRPWSVALARAGRPDRVDGDDDRTPGFTALFERFRQP
jgi:competence protein ComEC